MITIRVQSDSSLNVVDFLSALNGRRHALSFNIHHPVENEAIEVIRRTNPQLLIDGSWCSNSQSLDTELNVIASHGNNGWCQGNAIVSGTSDFLSSIILSMKEFENYCIKTRNDEMNRNKNKNNQNVNSKVVVITIPLKGTLNTEEWIANQYYSLKSLTDEEAQVTAHMLCVVLNDQVQQKLLKQYNISCFDGSVPMFVNHMMHDMILFRQHIILSLFRLNLYDYIILSDPQLIWHQSPTKLLTKFHDSDNNENNNDENLESDDFFKNKGLIQMLKPVGMSGFISPLMGFHLNLKNNKNKKLIYEIFNKVRHNYRNYNQRHDRNTFIAFSETEHWEDQWTLALSHRGDSTHENTSNTYDSNNPIPSPIISNTSYQMCGSIQDRIDPLHEPTSPMSSSIIFTYCGTDPLNISYALTRSNFEFASTSSSSSIPQLWHLKKPISKSPTDSSSDSPTSIGVNEQSEELTKWPQVTHQTLQARLLNLANLTSLTYHNPSSESTCPSNPTTTTTRTVVEEEEEDEDSRQCCKDKQLRLTHQKHQRIVKIILMQKDESELLADWIWYHGTLFGLNNLHIIDHASRHKKVISILKSMKEVGLDVRTYKGNFISKKKIITELARELASQADFIVALDSDEFLVLDFSSKNLKFNKGFDNNNIFNDENTISCDIDAIRAEFDMLPMDGRAYKLGCRNAACPDIHSNDQVGDGSNDHSTNPEMVSKDTDKDTDKDTPRRALRTHFGRSQSDMMQKTFYAGGTSFLFTDAGNHYGGTLADRGASMHDKHANPDRYFITSSSLSILHFQSPLFKGWKDMVLQRAMADGFHTWEPEQFIGYTGYNSHHASLYLLLKNGKEEDIRNKYIEYCSSDILMTNIETSSLRKVLLDRPRLLGESS